MYKFLIILIFFKCNAFLVHEYFIDMWKENYEGLPFEQIVYNMLKQDTEKNDVNYLAVPWVYLIDRGQLDKLQNLKIKNGFTVCGHWNYTKIIPTLKKIGIDTLFTPHAHHEFYQGIKIIPMAHFGANGAFPAEKDIYYSYIGASSHEARKNILKMNHPPNCIIIERNIWHFQLAKYNNSEINIKAEKNKNEYQDVLSRSRFSLCPRGAGHGTLRLWESLQAGAIPVLFSDNYILPIGVDWDKCLIKIDENKVNNLPKILSKISNEEELKMRQNCLKVSQLFSGNHLIDVIKYNYLSNG